MARTADPFVDPALSGMDTAALPSSSGATGSGVIGMVRQIGFALGVTLFVAIIGSPASPGERVAAFRLAWWTMAGITAPGMVRGLLLRDERRHGTSRAGLVELP